MKRLGVTLLEIMTAVLILAMAFLPLIGVIGTSTKDSDVANSQVFAQTSARNILDTFLDDVPFKAISVASTPDSGDFAYTEPDEVKALTSVDYGNLMSMAELSDVPEKDFYRVSFLSLMETTPVMAWPEVSWLTKGVWFTKQDFSFFRSQLRLILPSLLTK